MFREYVEQAYLPLAKVVRARFGEGCAEARGTWEWAETLKRRWSSLHIGRPGAMRTNDHWRFSVPVFLGEISPDAVQVQLFADINGERQAEVIILHQEQPIPGALNGYVYAGEVPAIRDANDYTVRAVPYRPGVQIPAELPLVAWQR
jgi:starch phosphorylase